MLCDILFSRPHSINIFKTDMTKGILNVGQAFPKFKKAAVVSLEKGKEFFDISSDELVNDEGRWTVMFWWPKDFTFVCPTEIAEFNKSFGEFRDRTTNLIGASTDSEFVHLAWRKNHDDLRDLRFPIDRKSTRLNSSHSSISYAVFCLKKKQNIHALGVGRCASDDLDDGADIVAVAMDGDVDKAGYHDPPLGSIDDRVVRADAATAHGS